eukprot:TRINITY_DN1133_c0_g1_i1.p1 TRINITY_DN1133_c0_g1~~TRINITY_DN1133_c0_g1_i1.p1  ORF type:complete len:269 (+),score=44.23 TRINITY_DN1133_c0_g1_i1:1-807(+)
MIFYYFVFFFFSSRRRHTRSCLVSWARRCVQETGTWGYSRNPTLFCYRKGELESIEKKMKNVYKTILYLGLFIVLALPASMACDIHSCRYKCCDGNFQCPSNYNACKHYTCQPSGCASGCCADSSACGSNSYCQLKNNVNNNPSTVYFGQNPYTGSSGSTYQSPTIPRSSSSSYSSSSSGTSSSKSSSSSSNSLGIRIAGIIIAIFALCCIIVLCNQCSSRSRASQLRRQSTQTRRRRSLEPAIELRAQAVPSTTPTPPPRPLSLIHI